MCKVLWVAVNLFCFYPLQSNEPNGHLPIFIWIWSIIDRIHNQSRLQSHISAPAPRLASNKITTCTVFELMHYLKNGTNQVSVVNKIINNESFYWRVLNIYLLRANILINYKYGVKWQTECLNIRFPLTTLLNLIDCVKQKNKKSFS